MIKRLDNAITELRHYRSDLQRNKWRTDVQERITTIDIIEQLIKERLYPLMPDDQQKAA